MHKIAALRLRQSLNDSFKQTAKGAPLTAEKARQRALSDFFLHHFFRAAQSTSDEWLLVGASSLLLRMGDGRYTRDIDLAWRGEIDSELEDAFRQTIERAQPAEPFKFEITKFGSKSAPDPAGYKTETFKATVTVLLGEKPFDVLRFDLGFHRRGQLPPDRFEVTLPQIFDPRGAPPVEVPVGKIENHLTDKVCAMYEGHNGGASTRYHDLGDATQIIAHEILKADDLGECFTNEKARRKVDIPIPLTVPAPAWRSQYPSQARTWNQFPSSMVPLTNALEFVNRCIGPVLNGEVQKGIWSPERLQWEGS